MHVRSKKGARVYWLRSSTRVLAFSDGDVPRLLDIAVPARIWPVVIALVVAQDSVFSSPHHRRPSVFLNSTKVDRTYQLSLHIYLPSSVNERACV